MAVVRLILIGLTLYSLLLYGPLLSDPSGSDPAHPAIRGSAILVVLLWPWGAMLPFGGRFTHLLRWCHILGCLLCILHITVAFHLGHGWSHAAAYEHTQQAGGFGWGIYANYAFVLLWLADVLWSWVALGSYLKRPAWLTWLVIGFMGFIVFNAAVVFAHDPMRWLSLISLGFPLVVAGTFSDRRHTGSDQFP